MILAFEPGDRGEPLTLLQKSPDATKIIYTLDGSTPIIGGANTLEYQNGGKFTSQDRELQYREVFNIHGQAVLGEVGSFHLKHDFIASSLDTTPTLSDIPSVPVVSSDVFGNGAYTVSVQYNVLKENKKYPAQVWAEIAPRSGYTGANRYSARVMVYSDSYEQKIRAAFVLVIQGQIDALNYQAIPKAPAPIPTVPAPTHSMNDLTSSGTIQYN